MATFIITLIIITALLLILITGLQSSKKEGTGSTLDSIGIYQIISVQKTSDLLEQITWGLVILLFSLSLSHSILLKRKSVTLITSPNLERFQESATTLPTPPSQHHEATLPPQTFAHDSALHTKEQP
jgi:preprotein translocase subunit SecG